MKCYASPGRFEAIVTMARFRYKAYTTAGDLCTGEVEAPDAETAKGIIYDQGLLPIDAILAAQANTTPWWQRDLFSGRQLPRDETVRFTRELATLLGAELSIDDALRLIIAQAPSRVTVGFTERLLERVLAGRALSDAIDDDRLELPPSYSAMVRAGEASGSLGGVFGELAILLERAADVRGSLRSALVYPAILFFVAMIAVALIMAVLLPNLAPVFENAGSPLPMAITVMLALKSVVTTNWLVCVIAFMASTLASLFIFTSPVGQSFRHQLVWRLPVTGPIVGDFETARFARVLGTLMKNGVPLLSGLEITARVARSGIFKSGIETIVADIREGRPLRDAVADTGVIAALGQRLIAVGEQSGRLDAMLLHLAVVLENDLKRRIDRMMSLLTPALTILIGLGIGGLILSVMNAILSVNDVTFQ